MSISESPHDTMADLATYTPYGKKQGAKLLILLGLLVAGGLSIFAFFGEDTFDPLSFAFAILAGSLCFLQALGLIRSALERNCYLRAGTKGIAIRLPQRPILWSYILEEQIIGWDDVQKIYIHWKKYPYDPPSALIILRKKMLTKDFPASRSVGQHLVAERLTTIEQRLLAIRELSPNKISEADPIL